MFLRIGIAALAVAAAIAVWPSPPDPLRDWSRREEELTQAIDRNPGRIDLLLERSDLRMARTDFGRNRGRNPLPDYAAADADLTRVLELQPDSTEALRRRGRVRVQRGVYKISNGVDPLSDLQAAEADLIAGGDRVWLGNARYNRGVWILKSGGDPRAAFEAAEADWTPAETADVLMRRGRVRAALRRFGEADSDFQNSIQRNPGNVWAFTWWGNAKRAQGDPAEADRFYTKAIGVNVEFAEAWEGRGHARAEQGRHADAAADFEEAIRLNPSLEPILGAKLQEAEARATGLRPGP